jgi:hypothetical protein
VPDAGWRKNPFNPFGASSKFDKTKINICIN